jgi:hypothetical protein
MKIYDDVSPKISGRNIIWEGEPAGAGSEIFMAKYACEFLVDGDINDDCQVNFTDFAALASNWLINCDQPAAACVHK